MRQLPSPDLSILTAKKELRRRMRALRGAHVYPAPRFPIERFSAAETFFVYRSFGTEADTHALIASLKRAGKRVVSPKIVGGAMIAVLDEPPYSPNRYGIEEASGAPYTGRIDVAILPLLAADRQGHRLGFGGGYYDRFLRDCPAVRIGYCHAVQVLDAVPFEPHDIGLDFLCTEYGCEPIEEVKA